MSHRRPTAQAAFTLVEILIVVVILGILASIVLPQFTDATAASKTAVAASTTRTVQAKIVEKYATSGSYPATIEDGWFVEGALPLNPLATDQTDPMIFYDTSATAAVTHPAAKTVTVNGAFWYNPANGAFRSLVPAQSSPAETLELYNKANSTDLLTYGATTD